MLGAEKQINPNYNEKEILNSFILNGITNCKIKGDVVMVDGYAFNIDRSVPKIIEYIGKESELAFPEIEISDPIVAGDLKTATITITAQEEINGISKIEIIQEGYVIKTYTYDNEKSQITIDFTVKQNGTYNVNAYAKLVKAEEIEINQLSTLVSYIPNGNTEYRKQHSVKLIVKEETDKVKSIKYQWLDTKQQPGENTFENSKTCNNGETITESGKTGKWYLWTLIETESGNKKIEMSDEFCFDNEKPSVTLTKNTEIGETLSVTLNVTAEDDKSGIASYSFSYLLQEESSTWTNPIEIKSNATTSSYTFENLNYEAKYAFKVIVKDFAGNESEESIQYIPRYYIIKDGVLLDENYVIYAGSKITQKEGYVYVELYTPSSNSTGIAWNISNMKAFSKVSWKLNNTYRNVRDAWGVWMFCSSFSPRYGKTGSYPWAADNWGYKQIIADSQATFSDVRTFAQNINPKGDVGYIGLQTDRKSANNFSRGFCVYELYLE